MIRKTIAKFSGLFFMGSMAWLFLYGVAYLSKPDIKIYKKLKSDLYQCEKDKDILEVLLK